MDHATSKSIKYIAVIINLIWNLDFGSDYPLYPLSASYGHLTNIIVIIYSQFQEWAGNKISLRICFKMATVVQNNKWQCIN